MTTETGVLRSRRALLAAALAAGVASIASALGRPSTAEAVDGDAVLVGSYNTASTETVIDTGTAPAIALYGKSDNYVGVAGTSIQGFGVSATSDSGTAVAGTSSSGTGVHAISDTYIGLEAHSNSGSAVSADSNSGIGVYGSSYAPDLPSVFGFAGSSGTGVQGFSTFGDTPPPTPLKTGVYGYAAQDSTARGVTGQSATGRGVNGIATSGSAVFGSAVAGYGLRGYASTGTAVYAATSGPKTGTAFRAVGKVKLDNCAGVATINTGTKSVIVTPGIDLTAMSAVVASLMGSAGGMTTVHRSAVNATANTFTIYLTANSTANVKVAWHVFG